MCCIVFTFLSFSDLFLPTSFRRRRLLPYSITFRYTTIGMIPLDEGSVHRTELYLTTHNTHKGQTSMPPAVYETTIPASYRPQIQQLDGAANRFRCFIHFLLFFTFFWFFFHHCVYGCMFCILCLIDIYILPYSLYLKY